MKSKNVYFYNFTFQVSKDDFYNEDVRSQAIDKMCERLKSNLDDTSYKYKKNETGVH